MQKIDRYDVLDKIYDNGRTVVYKAIDENGSIVAIKTLLDPNDQTSINKLYREFNIGKNLDSKYSSTYIELLELDRVYLIKTFDNGELLADIISAGAMDRERFITYAISLTVALDSLHQNNTLHLDLNPYNILCDTSSKNIKLLDFGESIQIAGEQKLYLKNVQRNLAYTSPELTGLITKSVDYRSDLYSLGVIFYQMLTGRFLFDYDDEIDLAHAHTAKIPQPLHELDSNIPIVLSKIIQKLLSKDKIDRYQSTKGLLYDLYLAQNSDFEDFELASEDEKPSLTIPKKLYGRALEIEQIDEFLTHKAATAAPTLITISGYSGVGKTAFIEELQDKLFSKDTCFARGKFDQYNRTTSYIAFIQAFKSLFRIFDANGSYLKSELQLSLGESRHALVRVIPDLNDILDADLSHHIDPLQLKNQLFISIERLLIFFLKYKNRIVLFIDDLQWIDSASLEIFDLLFTSKKLSNVLIIGAYRSNEVDSSHPIKLSLDRLAKRLALTLHIELESLKIEPIKELLRDTLKNDSVDNLASLLLQKTDGNPFFMRQFLDTLEQRNLLTLDKSKNSWVWNIEEIKKQNLTDNVVEHLIDKIDTLSPDTQIFLKTASVMGDTFNIKTINAVNNFKQTELYKALQESLNEGLIDGISDINIAMVLEDNYFNFAHDKIRQAAYSLINDSDKKIKHAQIAKELISHKPYDNKTILLIAKHTLESIDILDDIDKKIIIDILKCASIITKDSLAFSESIEYSKLTISLLDSDCWSQNYSNTFDIYHIYLDSISKFYAYSDAVELFNELLKNSYLKNIDLAKIYHLRSILNFTNGNLADSINDGIVALSHLDIDIPDDAQKLSIIKQSEIEFLDAHIDNIESFYESKDVSDEPIELAMEILVTIGIPAFVSRQDLFGVIAFKLARLSIEHGNSNVSSYGFMLCGMIFGAGLNRFSDGYRFGELAMRLQDRYDNKAIECKLLRVYGAYVASWVNPHEVALDILYRAYISGVENGDFGYAAYSTNHIFTRELLSSIDLNELESRTRNYREFITRANEPSILATQDLLIAIVKAFRGTTTKPNSFSSDEFNESEALEQFRKTGFKTLLAYHYVYKTQLCYTHEYYDDAIESAIQAEEFLVNLKGNILESELYFYQALSIIRKSILDSEYSLDIATIERAVEKFELYSSLCEDNFKSKYLTLQAMHSYIEGDFQNTIDNLELALALEDAKQITPLKALILELLGYIGAHRDSWRIAKTYLQESYAIYYDLGYSTKAKILYTTYSKIFGYEKNKTKSVSTSASNLGDLNIFDEETILRASQLISGKINKDELIEKFMQIIASSFGIQLGALILKDGNEFFLEGLFNIDSKTKIRLQHQSLINTTAIPVSIVNEVISSGETLIIEDAISDSRFAMDATVIELGVISAICAPIILKDELIGLVYMQNNLIKGFFDNTREKVLDILLTQTAITLELEHLYSHDKLTGVLSRFKLDEVIEKDDYSALSLLNISNLDSINSTYGYLMGDEAIKLFVSFLKKHILDNSVIYRFSGDEFVVISYTQDIDSVNEKATLFVEKLGEHKFLLDDIYLQMGCTIGIAKNDKNQSTSSLVRAHAAMKEARKSGTNRVLIYTPDSQFIKKQQETLEWIHKVRDAISEDRIVPFYQPIIDNITQTVYKYECLARLVDNDNKIISPYFFLEPARLAGLMPALTKIMLEKSFKYFSNKPYDFSINISEEDLVHNYLVDTLGTLCETHKVKPNRITLEILENISAQDNPAAILQIEVLKNLGYKIALDDFGSEKSNFMRLQSMNVDYIKIDGSYIKDIDTNPNSFKICQTIVHLARAINCRVVAEFVHSSDVYETVKRLGIEYSQGYHFSEPVGSI